MPLPQDTPSPQFEKPTHTASSGLYSFPKSGRGISGELPHLTIAPVGLRPRPQKRRSPIPGARLRDFPTLPPLHISLHNQSMSPTYSEHFLPARYNDYEEGLAPGGEYSCGGMRLFDLPLELDQTLLKSDIGPFANGGHLSAPTVIGRQHDVLRSGTPLSCENSPLSMTQSISSGTSSEGGYVENQDLAATPVVPGVGSEHMHMPHHRQL